jgi:hypothetical protein
MIKFPEPQQCEASRVLGSTPSLQDQGSRIKDQGSRFSVWRGKKELYIVIKFSVHDQVSRTATILCKINDQGSRINEVNL